MSTAPGVQSQPLPTLTSDLYKTIFVPVDNSPYSNRAVDCAVELGAALGSELTGCHVYAARMHDYRFKQMEYTLPEEYLEEQELERQRKIHDSLITMGLELVSDCYLEDLDKKCSQAGVECQRKMMDGKHSEELVREIRATGYDLVILGALGIGKVKDSVIGAVCERVTRSCSGSDIWVVKNVPEKDEADGDVILVGIDGSPQSFGALRTAIDLARRFGKRVEIVGVYDPYLHYAVFKGIVDVLTERASKVFRFEEQNQLHEEIIDTGLAQIYQSHLNVAEAMVKGAGVEVTSTLLDGKAFQKLLDHARKVKPWLTVVGRVGIHSEPDEVGLGSNAENLLRLMPGDVLFSTRLEYPELDLKAEEAIHWTPEAEERMLRVPEMVRGIARTAILRLAVEKGHSVVSNALVTEAMDRFMPKGAAQTTTRLAESLAIEKARHEPVSICRKCGVAAKVADPAQCSVCGATDFEVISQEMIERIAATEGGIEEETAYDGRKVRWTQDARRLVYGISDKYQMRRCKARIEKKARMNRVDTITVDFARELIEEETTEGLLPDLGERLAAPAPEAESPEAPAGPPAVGADSKGVPLHSRFSWTKDALERIFRVPAGFMRSKTQDRIEEVAAERDVESIDLELVEDGIEFGRQMMAQMIGQYSPEAEKPKAQPTQAEGDGEQCPVETTSGNGDSAGLNEAGWMSEMARRRKKLID